MFPKEPKIEDLILQILGNGPLNTGILIEKVREFRMKTTKQAVYKALRIMKGDEILIQTRENVSLSSIWLKKLSDFTEKARLHYKTSLMPDTNFLQLKQGEKISYSFKTVEMADMFWAHAFDVLSDSMPFFSPILIYNPHEWFFLARYESEVYIFERLQKSGKKLFLLAGGDTPLDKHVSRYFDGNITQYYASPEPIFPKSNYYFNIFDDFIIEAYIDPQLQLIIDKFYNENDDFNEEARQKIIEIIKIKGKNKLVIQRDKRKADKLRKVFKKYFLL